MSETAPGQSSGSENPQCYNCGVHGHWAIGCPEPTRQTPAGLVAWRNAANTQGRNRDGQGTGGGKRSTGPIITRYAPPPPPPPPSARPPYYPPNSQYTPTQQQTHPSSHQPQHSPYHSYPPLPPPPPPPPPVHPQSHYQPPSYPPAHHSPAPYQGHSSPVYPSHATPPQPHHPAGAISYQHHHGGYQPPPSTSGPPPAPLPARPPPSPAYSPPRDQTSHRAPPQPRPATSSKPSKARLNSATPRSASLLPTKPVGAGLASLPPKPPIQAPPPSNPSGPRAELSLEHQRDQRHNQKFERRNKNRNNKPKQGQSKEVSQDREKEPPGTDRKALESTQRQPGKHFAKNKKRREKNRLEKVKEEENRETLRVEKEKLDTQLSHSSPPPKDAESKPDETGTAKNQDTAKRSEEGAVPVSDLEEDWDETTIFQDAEPPHGPDETGAPLPAVYNEDIVLPRKWDSQCISSEFVKAGNLEEFIRPVRHTDHWGSLELDPAFISNGQSANGELVQTLTSRLRYGEVAPNDASTITPEPSLSPLKKRGIAALGVGHDASVKRRRSTHDPEANLGSTHIRQGHSPREPSSADSQERRRREDSGVYQRRPLVDRFSPNRRESGQRGQGQRGHFNGGPSQSPRRASRESSPSSSASSDLDSVEAELLGRPCKKEKKGKKKEERSPPPARNPRRRPETSHLGRPRDRGRS